MTARDEVVAQLRTLGVVPGGVLLVHTSFRAVRPVEGGAEGLIEALLAALGPAGTLAMPTWGGDDDEPFDSARTPAARNLGVTAETFRRRPGALRSDHPFAFSAEGPRAAKIVADPLPIPPHIPASPVGRVRDLDGQILLLGVGHDVNTTLHLAEVEAGVPYRLPHQITVVRGGRRERIDYLENESCCALFSRADAWLRARGLQADGTVGCGSARLMRSRDLVAAATRRLRADPWAFVHPPDAGCAECDEARRNAA